ncbi:Hypp6923 [Branchiostoma lanceolatum]|uniref:Hypp6923 protein n=1 Tax=Branchiostoma lanceolatum TaxID=7740 RepID=A0A8J9YVT3_BRALA|nr:Hypp6923 [Branchiostoma lanceolatum]
MPFPVEKFCGTWKAGSHSDNFSRFGERLGIPAEMVQKMREATFRLNASLSGDKFTFMYEIWGKQHEATFILGVEGEEGDPLVGGKRRVMTDGEHECCGFFKRC